MTLDEAIKHAEEVAKNKENNAKNYPRPDKSIKGSGRKYNAYLKCAEEHRQLAEWLKDYKRLLEQEPKTGHWIRIAGGSLIDDYRCDCCNQQPSIKKVDLTWGWDFTDYCPKCGAKMERG